MNQYIDDVIITLKLKMSNYNRQSEVYKEMLYTVEMLECAKRLKREERNKVSNRTRRLGAIKKTKS